MQIALTQRNMHGLAYTVGYTWSHALDQSTGERGGPSGNPFNQRLEYSNSEFDIRQRFTATVTYALPGRKGFGQMLEGWKVTSIVALNRTPWGVLGSRGSDPLRHRRVRGSLEFLRKFRRFLRARSSTRSLLLGQRQECRWVCRTESGASRGVRERCDGFGSGRNNKIGTAALYRWGCFVQGGTIMIPPALGTIGNMTRDMFRGNPFRNWDASVIKDWRFTERFSGEFRSRCSTF